MVEPFSVAKHGQQLFNEFAKDKDNTIWTYLPYGPFATYESFAQLALTFESAADPLMFAICDTRGCNGAASAVSAAAGGGGGAGAATDDSATGHDSTAVCEPRAVGMGSYLRINPDHGSIEVGHLNFSPALQNTSIATEAMYLMMQHAFDLGYRRYEWKCDVLNARSRRAAERFGFSFEGVFRQAVHYKQRNRDTAWFAIMDSEWPQLQQCYVQWLADENFDEQGRQRVALRDLTWPLLVRRFDESGYTFAEVKRG